MYKLLRRALIVFSLLAGCFAAFGLYSRYFDEPGGAFCPVQHEAVRLHNVKICHWSGVSMKVMQLLRTDVRHTGDPNMTLIKYSSGIVYQCFWFDEREFDYWIDGLKPPMDTGCLDNRRDLIMTRKIKQN
ncbi:MAG: hypothetical protein ABIL01_20615 [Pseudomonadota bacterium]